MILSDHEINRGVPPLIASDRPLIASDRPPETRFVLVDVADAPTIGLLERANLRVDPPILDVELAVFDLVRDIAQDVRVDGRGLALRREVVLALVGVVSNNARFDRHRRRFGSNDARSDRHHRRSGSNNTRFDRYNSCSGEHEPRFVEHDGGFDRSLVPFAAHDPSFDRVPVTIRQVNGGSVAVRTVDDANEAEDGAHKNHFGDVGGALQAHPRPFDPHFVPMDRLDIRFVPVRTAVVRHNLGFDRELSRVVPIKPRVVRTKSSVVSIKPHVVQMNLSLVRDLSRLVLAFHALSPALSSVVRVIPSFMRTLSSVVPVLPSFVQTLSPVVLVIPSFMRTLSFVVLVFRSFVRMLSSVPRSRAFVVVLILGGQRPLTLVPEEHTG